MNTITQKNYPLKKYGILAVTALAAIASVTAAHAQVIAQDNFSEGTVGSQMLSAGAAGNGWANVWADKNNLDRVQSGPLGYTDGSGNVLNTGSFSGSPNNLQSDGAVNPGTSSSEPERTLSATLGADALANTANADTVWMSFLWQGNNTSATGSLFRQASILFLKGASTTSTSPGGTEYADIGMPTITSATTSTVNPNVSMWFANGNLGSTIPSTAPLQSTWAANTGQTLLILIEMTGTATAWGTVGGSETMNVWVDPTLTQAVPTSTPDLTEAGQDLSGINAIRLSGGGYNSADGSLPGEQTFGNIIFGDTAADVEPIVNTPEPTTLALAAIGGLGLLAFRPKK